MWLTFYGRMMGGSFGALLAAVRLIAALDLFHMLLNRHGSSGANLRIQAFSVVIRAIQKVLDAAPQCFL